MFRLITIKEEEVFWKKQLIFSFLLFSNYQKMMYTFSVIYFKITLSFLNEVNELKNVWKYVATGCFATMLLVGCGDEKVSNDVTTGAENEQEQKQEQGIVDDEKEIAEVKELTNQFFEKMKNQEYETLSEYVTEREFVYYNVTPADYGEYAFGKMGDGRKVVVNSFEVGDVTRYDDTRLYMFVDYVMQIEGEEPKENIMHLVAVKEDGQWKLQTDTFIREIEGVYANTPTKSPIVFSKIKAYEHIYGILIDSNIVNQSEQDKFPDDYYLGTEGNPIVFRLLTDEGIYEQTTAGGFVLPIGADADLTLRFFGAKGQPLGLVMDSVYKGSYILENGEPENPLWTTHVGSFLEEITDERAQEIGEEIVTKLMSIWAAKTEEEAKEILLDTFGHYNSDVTKEYLATVEYGEVKSVDVEFSDTTANYNEASGSISFDTQVKVTKTYQDGSTTNKYYNLDTSIRTDEKNGKICFNSYQEI